MDIIEALGVVQERLLGSGSLPVQIRAGDFVNESEVDELYLALSVLSKHYRNHVVVPKTLALALVNISASFENRFYSSSQQDRLEDIGHELQRLAEELFSSNGAD